MKGLHSIEEELDFERKRLLALVECRIKRNEMDIARTHAEELFEAEMEVTLLKKTKTFVKCNSLLVKGMVFLIGILLLTTACLALNIQPSFYLVVELVVILSILSLMAVDALMTGRFERTMKLIMDRYDAEKQLFAAQIIKRFIDYPNAGGCS